MIIESPSLSTLTLCVECRYNLFQQLALKDFNWKVIMQGDHVVLPHNGDQYNALQKRIKKLQSEAQQRWLQQQQEQLEKQQSPSN